MQGINTHQDGRIVEQLSTTVTAGSPGHGSGPGPYGPELNAGKI